ncbi:hypothetical protein V8J88_03465 [Massilia sp. W12]|uniref:hypothetical protein n=1 Tax=Massilia sp. W12 TaxID=3126507 RepID=UPI0030CC247C
MSERSMTIHIANWVEGVNLEFVSADASQGPPMQASPPQAAYGASLTASATNKNGGCVGAFRMADAGLSYAISYNHPSGSGSTTVSVDCMAGYISGANAPTFPGHDSVAYLNLYRAINANNMAWVVPLGLLQNPPRNNCQDFVNSLFGENTRSVNVVKTAYNNPSPNGYVLPADFTGGQMAGFVASWVQQWVNQGNPANPAVTSADAKLLSVLANYINSAASNGPLTLWIPQISYVAGTSPSVFMLNGYQSYQFKNGANWDSDTVNIFLSLLAAGAHMVAISANADLPPGVGVQSFDVFFNNSGLSSRHDPGNSHYAGITNTTGTYYLSIQDDFAPPDCSLILAFLNARTVNDSSLKAGQYNTFIQLEGWQAGTSRHNADYDNYKQTLWNVSTFGAIPYSEKRATTVFLAPQGWVPQVYQITCMMPYVGAYASKNGKPQGWLNTSLVQIPPDAPPLPQRYIES